MVNDNPCLRLVKERRGVYRVPEPKILAGSNYADLGFELDEENGHLVAMCAIDNSDERRIWISRAMHESNVRL